MAVKIGVVLSGCGVMDGSEIHEAVLTLLAIDQAGGEAVCMAPNMEQKHVVNHLTNQEVPGEKRNVLVEAARIARGNIRDLKEVRAKDLDAVIFPGGYGAAKHLSTFAFDGPGCTVHPEVKRLLEEMRAARKPIGAICIAPATVAKAFQGANPPVTVTIGTDPGTGKSIEAMGAKHVARPVHEVQVDEANRLVTTPAYMLGPGLKEVWSGIDRLVATVVRMAKEAEAPVKR